MTLVHVFKSEFRNRELFTFRDAKIFFSKGKITEKYMKLIIHNLLKKKELKRISKGIYTFKSEAEIVGFAFSPFYYGLYEALSLHNLWEQETNPVVITTKKIRPGIRDFEGSNYLVKRIDKSMFFGFEPMKYFDLWIPVSTPEKTFIDFIYFKEHLPANAFASLKKTMDKEILSGLLKKCPAWVRHRAREMLGFE